MGISLGGGASSGSSSAVVTPEQTQQNQLTNQLLQNYIPVLQKTLSGAGDVYGANAQNIAMFNNKLVELLKRLMM